MLQKEKPIFMLKDAETLQITATKKKKMKKKKQPHTHTHIHVRANELLFSPIEYTKQIL